MVPKQLRGHDASSVVCSALWSWFYLKHSVSSADKHSYRREIPPSPSLKQQCNSECSHTTAGGSHSSDCYLDFSTQNLERFHPGWTLVIKGLKEQSTGLARQTRQSSPMAPADLPHQGTRWSWKDKSYYASTLLVFLRKRHLKEQFWSSGQNDSVQVRVPKRVTALLCNWNVHRNK